MRAFQLMLSIMLPWCIFGASSWRDDGRCGDSFPLPNGDPAQCDPDSDDFCCSSDGWCGSGPSHCGCTSCINYKANQEVDSLFENFGELYAAKDFDKLTELYTDDVTLMPPGLQRMTGKESVKAVANKLWANGVRNVEFKNDEAVEIGDEMVYSIGRFTQYFGDETVAFQGKYLRLFKRINGKLYVFISMFNAIG